MSQHYVTLCHDIVWCHYVMAVPCHDTLLWHCAMTLCSDIRIVLHTSHRLPRLLPPREDDYRSLWCEARRQHWQFPSLVWLWWGPRLDSHTEESGRQRQFLPELGHLQGWVWKYWRRLLDWLVNPVVLL